MIVNHTSQLPVGLVHIDSSGGSLTPQALANAVDQGFPLESQLLNVHRHITAFSDG